MPAPLPAPLLAPAPRRTARVVATVLLAATALLPATAANAATATTYKNCTAVHKAYSGGIAKAGVTKNVVHHKNGSVTKVALKGTVKHSTALYNANRKLDADKDGVACEKS